MINPNTGLEDPSYIDPNRLQSPIATPAYNSTPSTINTDSKPLTPVTAPARPDTKDWAVTDNQTVEGRIKGLIDANSPLMQQAQTAGLQQANARGLVNSSMAVGAAQNELYKAAVPIATADANIQANAAQFNATSPGERMARLNIDADMTKLTAQLDANKNLSDADRSALKDKSITEMASREGISNADRQASSIRLDKELGSRERVASIENDTRIKLAGKDNEYKLLISNNQGAASLYDTYQKAVMQINANDKLDAANKQKALDDQFAVLQAGLKMYQDTEGLNLNEIINPPGNTGNPPGSPPGNTGPVGPNPGGGALAVKQQEWDVARDKLVATRPVAPTPPTNSSFISFGQYNIAKQQYEEKLKTYEAALSALGTRPA